MYALALRKTFKSSTLVRSDLTHKQIDKSISFYAVHAVAFKNLRLRNFDLETKTLWKFYLKKT